MPGDSSSLLELHVVARRCKRLAIALRKTALSSALGLCSDGTCSCHRGADLSSLLPRPPPHNAASQPPAAPWHASCSPLASLLSGSESRRHYNTIYIQTGYCLSSKSSSWWLLCPVKLNVLRRMTVRYNEHEGLSSGKHLCRSYII